MQRQHVNLYQEALYERTLWLSAQQMLVIFIIILALATVLAYWQHYRLTQLTRIHSETAAQVAQQQNAIEALQARISRDPDPRLQREVNRMQSERQHLQALQNVAFEPFEQIPLAQFLRGIARQRPEGLWLTRIYISESGQDVILEGRTLDAELLPAFITALGLEQVFFGMAFREVRLADNTRETNHARATHTTPGITFRLMAGCEHNRCGSAP